ncbi:MAG: hypothetical protein JSS27_00310 [Planctomycetes bacterium]|nr:hypothetical protein [Planctomycetota bacterium]
MKRTWMTAALLVMVGFQMAAAENRRTTAKDATTDHPVSMGPVTPTPEMWFYEQAARDYNDPKMAVRHKAEYDAAQRRERIAAQSWYGMSKARPTANPVPHMSGIYSPAFTGNTRAHGEWQAPASVVVLPRAGATY